jgi:hypothetical protein
VVWTVDGDIVAVNSVLRLGPIIALTLYHWHRPRMRFTAIPHNERLYTLPLDAAVSVVSHLARLNSS